MKKILSVGQCLADHSRISQTLSQHFEIQIETADTHEEAIEKAEQSAFDLILINRLLDSTGTSGLDIVKEIKAKQCEAPIMLISNYDDAQKEAVANGAVQGFGKATLAKTSTRELLTPYLA